MPSAPMTPAHERDHLDRAAASFEALPDAARQRWTRANEHVENARVYDAFLEFNELLKMPGLDAVARTDAQLQAVRCLRDAPVERVKTELALIEPHDAYQTVVLDYRLGWLMRHRLSSLAAALQYFDRVREEARRLGTRPWEIAALLQKSATLMAQGSLEQAIEVCMRVYNLSRRNGLVEYIPKALMNKGYALVQLGRPQQGEEQLQKAYELACRNDLLAEQGIALHMLAQVYHHDFKFYGLALEYYEQARAIFDEVPVWPSVVERVDEDMASAQSELAELDLAKILGPIPIARLRQEYLTSLVNGFVGIPGIDNRTQLGNRIGLTRQAIHRNINS
ncbi:tetratricopeptide repeat protein [Rubricoccus marinus]|nr:tetratricopeptide repeat protein [Rubricoccus marinus]